MMVPFQVGAVPAAIQAMPIQKLQIALAKSIANLKTRDRAIETLKNQLAAMRASDTNESVHIPGAQARQAEQLRHRAEKAEDEVAELVKVSKASAAAHETQIQDLSMELTKLRRSVVEHDDSKVRCDAHRRSLHTASHLAHTHSFKLAQTRRAKVYAGTVPPASTHHDRANIFPFLFHLQESSSALQCSSPVHRTSQYCMPPSMLTSFQQL
jgi:hypothetical protein